jgi:hypothetical protein
MKNYTTKSKLFGYDIGLLNDNLYVAVPKKYLLKEGVKITCDGVSKVVTLADSAYEVTLADKFNKGMNYTLCYFLWKVYST